MNDNNYLVWITLIICIAVIILSAIAGFILLFWQYRNAKAFEKKLITEFVLKERLDDRLIDHAQSRDNRNNAREDIINERNRATIMALIDKAIPEIDTNVLKILMEKIKNINIYFILCTNLNLR